MASSSSPGEFARDGYCIIRRFLPPEEISVLLNECAELLGLESAEQLSSAPASSGAGDLCLERGCIIEPLPPALLRAEAEAFDSSSPREVSTRNNYADVDMASDARFNACLYGEVRGACTSVSDCAAEIVLGKRFRDIARALLVCDREEGDTEDADAEKVILLNEQYIAKPPLPAAASGPSVRATSFELHRDGDFLPDAQAAATGRFISCWVALTPANTTTGCLVIWPLKSRSPASEDVVVECEPGDLVVLRSDVWHRSLPNAHPGQWRIAFMPQFARLKSSAVSLLTAPAALAVPLD